MYWEMSSLREYSMLKRQLNYLLEHCFDYVEDFSDDGTAIDSAFLAEYIKITDRMYKIWNGLPPNKQRAISKNCI